MTTLGLPPELVALVASDEEIQRRVRALIFAALTEAEHTIRYGNPTQRAQLIKSAVPSLMRALSERKDNEEMEGLRDAVTELRAQFTQFALPTPATPPSDALPDTPTC